MGLIFLAYFGGVILAAAIGITWWVSRGRTDVALAGTVRTLTTVAAGVPLVIFVAYRLWGGLPFLGVPVGPLPIELARFAIDSRYVLPLAAALPMLLLLAVPERAPRITGSAGISRRTIVSFVSRGWWIAGASVLAVIGLITLSAGIASSPDEEGHWRMFQIELGTTTASTWIYGWYYSTTSLILIAGVLVFAALALGVVARPPLGSNPELDIARRGVRSRNIVAVALGALLCHLAAVLGGLAGTAGLRVGIGSSPAGPIEVGTPFAALSAPLYAAEVLALGVGVGLWFIVLLSAVRSDVRTPAVVAS